MRYLVLIFSVIFIVSGCTTIEEQYTREGIRVKPEEPEEYYDDSPSYYHYRSHYYNPVYWGGFYMGFPFGYWSPYSYYGFYDYYYGYYGGYYWGYPSYYVSRTGRSIITKRQLKKRTSSSATSRSRGKSVWKITSTGKIKSTVIKSGSSIRSRGTSSGRVSRGTVSRGSVRKKK